MSLVISADTTWTAAQSPITLNNIVVVVEGVTLTIEPGVVVTFNPGATLLVLGGIVANGTAGNVITFQPLSQELGVAISLLDSTAPGSRSFQYVYFHGCGLGIEVSTATVSYCKFDGSEAALEVYDGATPALSYCTISYTPAWVGVFIDEGSHPTFTDCVITCDIDCWGWTGAVSTFTITDCDLLINNLYNYSPGNPSALNCWWGTTNTSQIDAVIYDGNDIGSYGIVTYLPIRTAAVPGAGCGW
jgi:hypothetical protein